MRYPMILLADRDADAWADLGLRCSHIFVFARRGLSYIDNWTYSLEVKEYHFKGDNSVKIVSTILKWFIIKGKNLLQEGAWHVGKQTESHKNCVPCKIRRKIYHMYKVPVHCIATRKSESDIRNILIYLFISRSCARYFCPRLDVR